MGAKAETLAKQFEAKVQEATKLLEKLSDADWKKITSAEKWPVCVVAHHIAMSHEGIGNLVKSAASGQHKPSIGMSDIDQMNAKHAKDFATVGKAETLALHKKNAAAAAAIVRGLTDAQLDNKGVVLVGMPPMSAGDLAGGLLCGHVDEHLNSIRATVGH